MKKAIRKILMFVDNCIAHNNIPHFQNIKIHFLPSSTTSTLQPLDYFWESKMDVERCDNISNAISKLDNTMDQIVAKNESQKITDFFNMKHIII